MGEFCPIRDCNTVMEEHFVKKEYIPADTGNGTISVEYQSQGYWCPRCEKWFVWRQVQQLVEKF